MKNNYNFFFIALFSIMFIRADTPHHTTTHVLPRGTTALPVLSTSILTSYIWNKATLNDSYILDLVNW